MSVDNEIEKVGRRKFLQIAGAVVLGSFIPSSQTTDTDETQQKHLADKSAKDVSGGKGGKEKGETLPIPQGDILLRDTSREADDLWVVKSDGSEPIRITKDSYWNEIGKFSPGGNKIATARLIPHGEGLMEVAVWEDGDQNIVSPNRAKWYLYPSWSSNDKYLSFSTRDRDENPKGVIVVDTETNQTDTIPAGIKSSWSPSGLTLAVSTANSIDLWEVTGKSTTIDVPGKPDNLSWSPDGLYFDTVNDGWRQIHKFDPKTGETKLVASPGWSPRVSPSGKFMLYRSSLNVDDANRIRDIKNGNNLPGRFSQNKWVANDILFSSTPLDGAIYSHPITKAYKTVAFEHEGVPIDFSTNFKGRPK